MNQSTRRKFFCAAPRMGWLSVVCTLILAAHAGNAQNAPHKVAGRVTGEDNLPLIGAFVTEKGTVSRAVTDEHGDYTITVANHNASLVVSYFGMDDMEIEVGTRTRIDIKMLENATMIDDVVVIGYGTVRKSDLTGSVASFRAEEMDDRLVLSIEDALRGQIAGVTVGSNDGQPGEQLNIRIRGVGSINASSAPLYVVDGVPMEELSISHNEVEHMEILKDASATAIYGSRGANGVVLITTKKGEKGKARINVAFKASLQQPVRLIEMMDSYNYNFYRNMQRRNVYASEADIPSNRQSWDRYFDKEGYVWVYTPTNRWYVDQMSGKYLQEGAVDTDWQRLMLRNTMTYDGRVNISGGTDQSTYSVVGSFLSQEGMVLQSGFQKYSIRANFDQQVNRRMKMGFNVSGSRSFQQGAYSNETDGTMMNMLAQQPVKAPNYTDVFEDVEGESALYNNNPWFQATNVRREVGKDNVMAKLSIDHTIGCDFRLNMSGSYTMANTANDQFYPTSVRAGNATNGLIRQNSRKGYDWLNENLLYYTPKAKGKHRYDAMVGLTFQENTTRSLKIEKHNVQYDKLKEWGVNYGLTTLPPELDHIQTRMVSGLARANYTYDDRYLFTASIRADGSSRFGKDHKWGYFPSGAFAWRVSQEEFLKNVRWISDIKVRMSAGVSGNTAIPAYQSLAMTTVSNYPMDGYTPSAGATADRIENPALKWETSTQYDAGVDVSLFKNRLSATADFYYKQTRDLLLVERVTGTSGQTTRWSNMGEVDNKGIELTLTGQVVRNKNVKWSSSFNVSFNRSKVRYIGESGEMILDASGAITNNFAILREGMPVGLWYGYQTDGLYRTFAEIEALSDNFVQFAKNKSSMGPGFLRYVDQNGDGLIDEGDRVVLGSAEPKFTGGWSNTVSWKNFKLNVNTDFSYGRKLFNATALMLERGVQTNNTTIRYQNNYWHPTLYDRAGNVVFQGNEDSSWLPGTPRDAAFGETYAKDLYIEDGSYFRISDVSLSYDLPSKLLRKVSAQSVRLIASVRNAWIWTKYTGYDPDVNSVTGDYADLIPGLDNGSYPRARTYTFGINVTF